MHKKIMYICPMYSKEIIKGTLKPIVLKLLKEQGRMYGYEITQKVRDLTKDKIQITEGALYPLLHKLEADGIVTTEVENIGKRVRKYYKLTIEGETISKQTVDEFLDFMDSLKNIMDDTKPALGYGAA
jgi:PadR family transcriptional regulator, regulatory protein PadR